MSNVYGIDAGGQLPALETRGLTVTKGSEAIVRDISMVVPSNRLVSVVGPSGCGKTTLLKSLNRMNDFCDGVKTEGEVLLHGHSIFDLAADPVEVRRRVGMVFQSPNPFPSSVFENVAFGPRVNGLEGDLNQRVEEALRRAALWEEVSHRLQEPALALSGGQQQRLCIARALAVDPEVLLMDEPASELDPGATQRIEELVHRLKEILTIVLVTHNMQQAARISDFTAFVLDGELVEYGPTPSIFTNPREDRTEAYITGRFP
jgi:phosphate transport system ATP-binding protein